MALGKPSVLRRAGSVEHQISGHPSDGQHQDDPGQLYEGCLMHNLRNVILRLGTFAVVRSHPGAKHFVIFARPRVVVVFRVGDTPRVVRYEQG